jgi:hypothetical protein
MLPPNVISRVSSSSNIKSKWTITPNFIHYPTRLNEGQFDHFTYFGSSWLNYLYISFKSSCTNWIENMRTTPYLTWINSWQQTTLLLVTVHFLNHSTALSLAVVLSTDIVSILAIPHSIEHCSNSLAIVCLLWFDTWRNASILLWYF